MFTLACAKVNLEYARKNAIGSPEHLYKLGSVDGTVNVKFMNYQCRMDGEPEES